MPLMPMRRMASVPPSARTGKCPSSRKVGRARGTGSFSVRRSSAPPDNARKHQRDGMPRRGILPPLKRGVLRQGGGNRRAARQSARNRADPPLARGSLTRLSFTDSPPRSRSALAAEPCIKLRTLTSNTVRASRKCRLRLAPEAVLLPPRHPNPGLQRGAGPPVGRAGPFSARNPDSACRHRPFGGRQCPRRSAAGPTPPSVMALRHPQSGPA